MRPNIENRKFTSADGVYVEMSDFEARWPGRKPERTWTCFCAWFPDVEPTSFVGRFPEIWRIDAIASVRPKGTWLMGGYSWLEKALLELEAKAPAD